MRIRMSHLALVLLTASAASAADVAVRIAEVGLRGYPATQVTRVRLLAGNPNAAPQQVDLHIRLWSELKGDKAIPISTFRYPVTFAAFEKKELDLPLVFGRFGTMALTVDVVDGSGKVTRADARKIEYSAAVLIAIYCGADQQACNAAQSQITYAGSAQEQTERGSTHKYVSLSELERHWWSYLPAAFVVLAAPLTDVPAEHRLALEEYVRHGGRVIVVLDAVGKTELFSGYLKQPLSRMTVGRGTLFRLDSMRDNQLRALFDGVPLEQLTTYAWQDPLWSVRQRMATFFEFPRLRWLLVWLAIYIIVLGPVNFALLRRWRRLELGWITVPLIAAIFAVLLFYAGSRHRPRVFHLDELNVLWMDEHSEVAAVESLVRVVSPGRVDTELQVPPGSIFKGGDPLPPGFAAAMAHLFASGDESAQGWDLELGTPLRIELPLLRWSYRDLTFETTHRLHGTVRRDGNSLRNETGVDFGNAIFVADEKIYYIGRFASGTSVEPRTLRWEKVADCQRRLGQEGRADGHERPFELAELAAGYQPLPRKATTFLAITDEKKLEARLDQPGVEVRPASVYVVSFEDQP